MAAALSLDRCLRIVTEASLGDRGSVFLHSSVPVASCSGLRGEGQSLTQKLKCRQLASVTHGVKSVRGRRPHLAGQRLRMAAQAQVDAPAAKLAIMVNDCSGKMGHAVGEAVVAAGLTLVPLAITGPSMGGLRVACGGVAVDVRGSEQREEIMDEVLKTYPNVVVVDYTLPAAVNGNAEFYCSRGVPFVMGTTGGDREKLLATVRESGNYAVIAPNMGKQVVAFQAAMEIMAENFPGAFAGYKLKVTESHQTSKVDTSGTAKAIVGSFQKLGINFDVEGIEKVRESREQMTRMAVPETYLDGHAFHTYRLTSSDSTVSFEFQHNVCGRSIYAQGTVDAAVFLASKMQAGAEKKLYNMIDVLQAGSMR